MGDLHGARSVPGGLRGVGNLNMRINVDRNHFVLPGYIFREPIISPVPNRDYQGKSLEQIGKEYGKQASSLVYWCACHGKDFTKVRPTGYRTKDVVELRKDETASSIKLFICANTYTTATEDQCILDVGNINPQISKQHRKQLVNDAIRRLFTQKTP